MSVEEIHKLTSPEHIRLLNALADCRSFSQAAVRLGISQPSVSQQVRRLEKAVGRELFWRKRRGVELTPDGEALLLYAKTILALTHDLRRQLEINLNGSSINIGLTEDFCRSALPRVLRIFLLEYPTTRICVRSGRYEELDADLRNGRLDFAILRRHPHLGVGRTLWTEPAVWVGHLDPRTMPSDSLPLIVPIAPNPARDIVLDTLTKSGRTWRVSFEAHSLAGIEAALQAGLGIFAIPRGMPMHDVDRVGPEHALPDLPDVEFTLVVPPDRMTTDAERAFVDIVGKIAALGF